MKINENRWKSYQMGENGEYAAYVNMLIKGNLKPESHAEQWKTRLPMIRSCLRLREQDLIMGRTKYCM